MDIAAAFFVFPLHLWCEFPGGSWFFELRAKKFWESRNRSFGGYCSIRVYLRRAGPARSG
jgi:hypothetical protein